MLLTEKSWAGQRQEKKVLSISLVTEPTIWVYTGGMRCCQGCSTRRDTDRGALAIKNRRNT
jgi:hypothetical protein